MSELTSEKLARRYRAEGNHADAAFMESVARQTRLSSAPEPFTAITDCPKCGHLAVHWLAEPMLEPEWDDTPAGKAGIRIDRMINTMLWTGSRYDPPRTAVARVCVKCGYRWGQS